MHHVTHHHHSFFEEFLEKVKNLSDRIMQSWQVQEAKMKLSSLIAMAKKTPQLITLRGNPEVVVLSAQEYEKLKNPNMSLLKIMQKCPGKTTEVAAKRSRDKTMRRNPL